MDSCSILITARNTIKSKPLNTHAEEFENKTVADSLKFSNCINIGPSKTEKLECSWREKVYSIQAIR